MLSAELVEVQGKVGLLEIQQHPQPRHAMPLKDETISTLDLVKQRCLSNWQHHYSADSDNVDLYQSSTVVLSEFYQNQWSSKLLPKPVATLNIVAC